MLSLETGCINCVSLYFYWQWDQAVVDSGTDQYCCCRQLARVCWELIISQLWCKYKHSSTQDDVMVILSYICTNIFTPPTILLGLATPLSSCQHQNMLEYFNSLLHLLLHLNRGQYCSTIVCICLAKPSVETIGRAMVIMSKKSLSKQLKFV